MGELGVMGKQAGSHAYKRTTARRIDMSNRLNRQFDVGYTEPVLGWP
jgi:putative transposase